MAAQHGKRGRVIRRRHYCQSCQRHGRRTLIGHMVWRPTYREGYHFEPNAAAAVGIRHNALSCVKCAREVEAAHA